MINNFIKTFIQTLSDSILLISFKGEILSTNEAACELLGTVSKNLIGMPFELIFEDGKIPFEIPNIEDWAENLGFVIAKDVNSNCRIANGDIISIIINATIIIGNNEAGGILCQLKSQTTKSQSEVLLSNTIKELKSINQELNDFAYIISHDLKAPLRSIDSLAKWLIADYGAMFDDEGKKNINMLVKKVERMHNLIEGVLAYSRLGRISDKKIYVNLNEIVAEAIEFISPPDSISITVADNLPTVLFEKTKISQVFQNLISNAVKYMAYEHPQGDKSNGEISIGCSDAGSYWKIWIKDNGRGIEEQHFEKIFKIFQTINPTNNYESTGLGLTMVKKIIEMYSGKIWVESKINIGSTFIFTLLK